MKLLRLTLIPLLVGLFTATGCNSGVTIAGVTVTAIEVKAATATAQPQLVLQLSNENIFALALSKTEHKLYLNNQYAGRAVNTTPVGLMQLSAVKVTLPLEVENTTVIQQLRGSKAVSYRLDTVVRMDVSDSNMKHSTSSSGQVDITTEAEPAGK